MLLKHNNFVPLMRQVYETLYEECNNGNTNPNLAMHLHFEQGRQARHYNVLQTDEIALILLEDGDIPNATHDIVICLHRGVLHYISECHPTYLPLHYILLFLHGKFGWHPHIPHIARQLYITQTKFFSYRLFPQTMNFLCYYMEENYSTNLLLMHGQSQSKLVCNGYKQIKVH